MVTDFYPPYIGGVERVVADLSAELSARAHDVSVATLWHDGLERYEQDGRVAIHRMQGATQRLSFLFAQPHFRYHPPIPDPLLTRQLQRLIAAERPDVVHGHTWMMNSVLPLRREFCFAAVSTLHDYALICPKKTLLLSEERPCVHHLSRHCITCAPQAYGLPKGLLTTAGLALGRGQYRGIDAYMAISSYVAEVHARDGLAMQTPLVTIPNFVRDDVLRAPRGPRLPNLPQDYILFVGALSHHKGIQVLLDAYERLQTDLPLVLIGQVRPETPATFPPNVIMRPNLPHDDVIRAMDHCRYLVAPSLWPEPFGLVAIEAMARGKAVVASCAGGVLDIVRHGQTGLLVPPGDAQGLAGAMRTLIDDPQLTERMGCAGAARCADHFSADAVVPRVVEVYEQARARKQSTPRTRRDAGASSLDVEGGSAGGHEGGLP